MGGVSWVLFVLFFAVGVGSTAAENRQGFASCEFHLDYFRVWCILGITAKKETNKKRATTFYGVTIYGAYQGLIRFLFLVCGQSWHGISLCVGQATTLSYLG